MSMEHKQSGKIGDGQDKSFAAKKVTVDEKLKYVNDTDYTIVLNCNIRGPVKKTDIIGSLYKHNGSVLPEVTLEYMQIKRRLGRFQFQLTESATGTSGVIMVPVKGDAANTALVAGNLETIEKVGPFSAIMKVDSIRSDKAYVKVRVFERAKTIFNTKFEDSIDSLADFRKAVMAENEKMNHIELAQNVFGGPHYTAKELYVVEGIADVKHLANHKVYNTISVNGANFDPKALDPYLTGKTLTVIADADRGGGMMLKKLAGYYQIEYVVDLPKGTSVETLPKAQLYTAIYHNKRPYHDDHN